MSWLGIASFWGSTETGNHPFQVGKVLSEALCIHNDIYPHPHPQPAIYLGREEILQQVVGCQGFLACVKHELVKWSLDIGFAKKVDLLGSHQSTLFPEPFLAYLRPSGTRIPLSSSLNLFYPPLLFLGTNKCLDLRPLISLFRNLFAAIKSVVNMFKSREKSNIVYKLYLI